MAREQGFENDEELKNNIFIWFNILGVDLQRSDVEESGVGARKVLGIELWLKVE